MAAPHPLGIAHEAVEPSNFDAAAHNYVITFGYVLGRAAHRKNSMSILDWGSGIGHYYVFARELLPEVQLDYHCVDMPGLCQVGREVLPGVAFHEDADVALDRTYDLVLASTSLQYSQNWKDSATRLANTARSFLYVTSLPLLEKSASFAVVQRAHRYGYHTEYVGWFINRQEFLSHMQMTGLNLIREFIVQARPYVVGAPEQGRYCGFLFARAHV